MTANPSDDPVAEFLAERCRDVLGATPWLAIAETEQQAAGMGSVLRNTGADDVLALGISKGAGPIDDTVPLIGLDEQAPGSMMSGIRHAQAVVADLPADAVSRIDDWDPTPPTTPRGEPTARLSAITAALMAERFELDLDGYEAAPQPQLRT